MSCWKGPSESREGHYTTWPLFCNPKPLSHESNPSGLLWKNQWCNRTGGLWGCRALRVRGTVRLTLSLSGVSKVWGFFLKTFQREPRGVSSQRFLGPRARCFEVQKPIRKFFERSRKDRSSWFMGHPRTQNHTPYPRGR